MNQKTAGLHPHTCEVCGKEFECTGDYVYKIQKKNLGNKYHFFCSWTCIQKYRKEHEKRKLA